MVGKLEVEEGVLGECDIVWKRHNETGTETQGAYLRSGK